MIRRRDFLKDSAALGVLASLSGCATADAKIVEGPAVMQGFADRPIPEVKVGIVGVGMRANDAMECLTHIPGCAIVAVCDLLPERIAAAQAMGEYAKTMGGHGGMDFIMNLRWVHCLQKGLPLDMDVYDLAAVCSLGKLTERSVRGGSVPVEIPDFTRGGWKRTKPPQ